jgi:hypothetical protein
VTVALAFLLVSAALVAVTECVPAAVGAVYIPVVLIVPPDEFPPATPSTDQFTAVLLVPCTTALNCCCAPVFRVTAFWLSWIVTFNDFGGGVPPPLVAFMLAHPTEGRINANTSRYFEKEEDSGSSTSIARLQQAVARMRDNRCKLFLERLQRRV